MLVEQIKLEAGLYIVATPIGNLADITLRALQTLSSVDYIICEDTRVTNKLLNHYGIKAAMLVYNDHSDQKQRNKITELITAGKSLALVSDAGTPLIADPGYKLVRDLLAVGCNVSTCPGPCAAIAALTLSGMPSDNFFFMGFFPPRSAARIKILNEIKLLYKTTIFYETASRLLETLADIKTSLGNCEIAVVREISKMFEEAKSGPVDQILEHFTSNPAKGEIVLILGKNSHPLEVKEAELVQKITQLLPSHSIKDIATILMETTNYPKKEIYKKALELKDIG